MGRISLNPLRHVDLVGTLLLPAILLFASSGAFVFGWAKPVPVNVGNLRRPEQDMLWVAAAGPAANLMMAVGWTLLLKIVVGMPENMYSEALKGMARVGIGWNVGLMVLNLLPVLPLDGGRMAVSLLPLRAASKFARIEPYGLVIVVALLYFHVLDVVLDPVFRFLNGLLLGILRF
jgi:Zn-dependent protease